MVQAAVHQSKIARNAPCPCGKQNRFGPIKYKRCCGRGVKAPRTPTTPVIEFLRETTYAYAWGEEKILTTTTESFIDRYNRGHRRKLTNGDFDDHFNGVHKLYFFGNPMWLTPKLAMIDTDAQKSKKLGSRDGVERFARHVDKKFKDWGLLGTTRGQEEKIHHERSSLGLGDAGYFIITGADNDKVRAAYDHLEQVLKAEAAGFDVEGVELKGKPPKIEYGDASMVGKPQIKDITFGSLAKYPAHATIEDLRRLPTVHFEEIFAIPLLAATATPTTQAPSEKEIGLPRPGPAGSYSPISSEYLDELPAFRRMAEYLFPVKEWTVSGTFLTVEDLAIQLFLDWYLTKTERSQDDHAKPCARYEKLWDALRKEGYTARDYHHGRHAAMRNYVSDLGLLTWHDHTYHRGFGKAAPGKFLKYSANAKFMELLANCQLAEKVFGADAGDSGADTPTTTTPRISPLTGFQLPSNVPIVRPKRLPNPHLPRPMLVIHGDIEPHLCEWEPRRMAA